MAREFSDFDWNLLKTFRSVAQNGSVSGAARALGREQPSVSAALKRLEDHVGLTLCRRSSRGIVLTPAGQAVLETCTEVDDAIERLAEAIRPLRDEAEATLAFRMVSDVVSPTLDRALVAFHQTFPKVDVRIDIAPWRAVLRAVRANEVTLGVACDIAPTDDLVYRPLLYEVQQLYCGATHPRFGTAPVRPEDLSAEVFVSTGEDEPDELRQFRLVYNLGRRSCGTAETLHEVRKLIEMGFGIGFLPTVVADNSDEALWPLLPAEILPRYPLYIVANRSGRLPPHTRHLVEAFLAGVGEPDYA